jgi:hypothetical protein
VWTGSQLLIWGGSPGWCDEQPPERDGMAFDASSNAWTAIPPAPVPGRCFPAYAWTGRELLIWGGWDGSWSEEEPGTLSDGAAYDPATNQWRVLPPSGLTARAPLFVWTGEELIVWGTSFRTRHRPLDGAAYDPVSDSWRMITEGPIELTDAVGAWSGSEMIVFGAALHGGNFPETPTAIGAAYNPASDAWRRLPESDIDPNANTASWLEDRLIAWDYSAHTSAYSPGSDTWASLGGPPVDACEDVPESVTAEGFVFGQLCGELVMMRPGEDGWHNVTRRDLPFWPASFGPAEDLVFVLGHESFDQGAPTKMFAFRPPASFACGGFPGLDAGELAAAVAARFELLRSYRSEELARPEIADLVTAAGEGTFVDPASGLGSPFHRRPASFLPQDATNTTPRCVARRDLSLTNGVDRGRPAQRPGPSRLTAAARTPCAPSRGSSARRQASRDGSAAPGSSRPTSWAEASGPRGSRPSSRRP